ncbi:hypothetical protein LZ30DRAFT_72617 [Colletotrichum cereale]|nr:hypothetical protein LZ30DRAFT_72617 [Colletotrichum cereale]
MALLKCGYRTYTQCTIRPIWRPLCRLLARPLHSQVFGESRILGYWISISLQPRQERTASEKSKGKAKDDRTVSNLLISASPRPRSRPRPSSSSLSRSPSSSYLPTYLPTQGILESLPSVPAYFPAVSAKPCAQPAAVLSRTCICLLHRV